uniref:Uncharacterized protein n=2 Tax=Meloidogyne TaxID=189290 RepID=A0A6V7VAD3_MELEN|nr:unnamed protein product [Meloidogyne enterolobii]CAD2171853.1 unnamed protein product [Meloidogyne enterolobii]
MSENNNSNTLPPLLPSTDRQIRAVLNSTTKLSSLENNSTASTSLMSSTMSNAHASGHWWTVLIIAAVIIIILLLIGSFIFAILWRKRSRKIHGEYKPQQVEHLHAKDLPYITPPNIEGLM